MYPNWFHNDSQMQELTGFTSGDNPVYAIGNTTDDSRGQPISLVYVCVCVCDDHDDSYLTTE